MSHLNTYGMGLGPLEIFLLLQSSESDVYRRQILTTEVDPCAVRVNPCPASSIYIVFID